LKKKIFFLLVLAYLKERNLEIGKIDIFFGNLIWRMAKKSSFSVNLTWRIKKKYPNFLVLSFFFQNLMKKLQMR